MTGSPVLRPDLGRALHDVLTEARSLGFLGPGDVSEQIGRSLGFLDAVDAPHGLAVDLGSGGGLPGLVLAIAWDGTTWALIDANHRRTEWLHRAVARLGLAERVTVFSCRAEEWARTAVRGAAQLVVARGFGPPAVTAECGAPLLRTGGLLAVAEPPGGRPERWPDAGLAELGLSLEKVVAQPVAVAVIRSVKACPDRYPRRIGVPAKRPLF